MTGQTGFSWADVVFLLGGFTVILAAVAFVIWQIFATYRARAAIAREQAYQKLAESSARTQERIAEDLTKATRELEDLRTRMASVERMLREVG